MKSPYPVDNDRGKTPNLGGARRLLTVLAIYVFVLFAACGGGGGAGGLSVV